MGLAKVYPGQKSENSQLEMAIRFQQIVINTQVNPHESSEFEME